LTCHLTGYIEILRGERSITASTALRHGKFFNVHPEFWMNLQKSFDLQVAQKEEGRSLKKIKPFRGTKMQPSAPLELPVSGR